MNNTLTSTISQHISKLKTPLIASALCLVLHQDHPIENQAPNQDKISTHTSISHIPNKAQADSLQDQALALYYTRDYTPAMQKYLQALDIYIILQDHKNIYYCNLDIGKILFESQNYNQAIHYFEQAYLHVHKTTYIRGEAISLIRTMRIHNMTNHPKQSYQYYQKGLAIFEQLKQQNKLSDPDLYGRYIEFLSHATYITKETNHEADYLYISQEFARISTKNMTPNDLGPYYIRLGDMKIAKKDYTTALRYYTQVTNNPKIDSGIVSGGLYGKSMAYEGLKDYKQALEYYKLYTKYQSKVTNTQAQKEKVEVEAKHTTEKHELQLTKQKLELENKNIIIATKTKETKHLLYGLFTSLLALSTLIFLRDKMRKAKLLANKEKSISDKTKQEIELQNQFIQESLHYGYNIQQSILPKKEEIETLFNKHIMIFQPRDIVSGDFYRVKKTKQENIFAQIDYTGHGIPGALLSTFGYYFFEEAIKKGKKTPADILNFIDKHFNETLYKKGRKETAEMMLISHNPSQGTITYAGAGSAMLYIPNNQTQNIKDQHIKTYKDTRKDSIQKAFLIKGENKFLGNIIEKNNNQEENFTNKILDISEGGMLYMFSDGFKDQMRNNKLMRKEFIQMLINIKNKDIITQQEEIQKILATLTVDNKQVDDISLFGFRFDSINPSTSINTDK